MRRIPSKGTEEIKALAASVRLYNALQADGYLRCVCIAKCRRNWETGQPRDCKHPRAQEERS